MMLPTHLSPSTINSFIQRRSEWYMNKIAKVKQFKTSHFLQRGKGVEEALQTWLETKDENLAIEKGIQELWNFEEKLEQDQLDQLKVHGLDLPSYLQKAIEVYSGFQWHEGSQKKIEVKLPGCNIPVIGYIDFDFKGFWTDLKVLSRKPSGLSQGYSIQGAVYYLATKKPGVFTCLVKNNPKSGPVFHCHQEYLLKQRHTAQYWVDYASLAAQAIEGVYKAAYNGDVDALVKHLSFPDLDSFYSDSDRESALQYWSSAVNQTFG